MSLADVVDLLRCPVCAAPFELPSGAGTLRCGQGHSFDVARQGYINLAPGAEPPNADTAAMVTVRERFLGAGHYRAITEAVTAAAVAVGPERVLDCGAGPGHYLARVLDAMPGSCGVALDVSVAAARRAARAHPRLGSIVADAWRPMPVAPGAVDLALSIFAPRQVDDLHRILAPHGELVTVTPLADHLRELRAELGLLAVEPNKRERLAGRLARGFAPGPQRRIVQTVSWEAATVSDVVLMGPNAFHRNAVQLAAELERLTWPQRVTLAVEVSRWARRP
jgi:23S rRNA (guanine745-N1)-methyltransferase